MNGYGGGNTRRRMPMEKQGPTVVHQKPGPLQTIFNLLPDEVTDIKLNLLVLLSITKMKMFPC